MNLERVCFVVLLSLLVVVVSVQGAKKTEYPEANDVIVLTDDTWEKAVNDFPSLLIRLHLPFDKDEKLDHEFAEAASIMKKSNKARLAHIDVMKHIKIAKKYRVHDFPYMLWFRGTLAGHIRYDGGLTARDIQTWLLSKSGRAIQEVKTEEELEALKSENEIVVLVTSTQQLTEKHINAIKGATHLHTSVLFAITTNVDLAEGVDVDESTLPAVILYKHFDEKTSLYPPQLPFDVSSLDYFVNSHGYPRVAPYKQLDKSNLVLIFTDAKADYHADLMDALQDAIQTFHGFMFHRTVSLRNRNIQRKMQITREDYPVVLIYKRESTRKYRFALHGAELISEVKQRRFQLAKKLVTFELDFVEDRLQPTLRSAQAVDDSKRAVKVIVGNNFQERVMESKKHVLLMIYSPSCEACMNLAPIYQTLAKNMAGHVNLVVAQLDAMDNEFDHESFTTMKNLPTVYLFKATDKAKPIRFIGERNLNDLTQFLEEELSLQPISSSSSSQAHDET